MRARARAALARGQRMAENLMTDTCQVTRPTGRHILDPATGRDVPEMVQIYSGPCKLQSTPQTGESIHTGDYVYSTESPRLHLPHRVAVKPGDEAVITASKTRNPSVDLRMRLVDLNRGTYRTAQRWNVEVITG